MRIKHAAVALLLLLVLGVLSACAGISAEQRAAAIAALDEMLAKGIITKEQYDALLGTLGGSMSKLVAWLSQIGETALTAFLAYAGITWRRGPVGARKGIVAEAQKK